MVPLHQLLEIFHKIDIVLDKVQVANTPPNQHYSGVDLPTFYKNFIEHVVFLFLHLFDNSFSPNRQTVCLNFQFL